MTMEPRNPHLTVARILLQRRHFLVCSLPSVTMAGKRHDVSKRVARLLVAAAATERDAGRS